MDGIDAFALRGRLDAGIPLPRAGGRQRTRRHRHRVRCPGAQRRQHPDHCREGKHKVNGSRAPQVESVWINSRPKDGSACGAGKAIDILVTFDLRAETLGTSSLLLALGHRYRHASLHRLQWNRVQFRYIVQEEGRDPDGITLASMELFFNGGYIRSVAGTDPIGDLGCRAIGGDGSHKVDGSRASVPEVRRVTIISRPQVGATYGAGESIEVLIGFDVGVEPAGNPGLALTVGAARGKPSCTTMVGATSCSTTRLRQRTPTRTGSASPAAR